jgi:hypothetical protein
MSTPSLATGIKATHIGPETGETGIATAGGESGAGTREQSVPANASGLNDPPLVSGQKSSKKEARSFSPATKSTQTGSTKIAGAKDVRNIADGKNPSAKRH